MNSAKPSLREIFADAAEIADPAARASFLDSACKGDGALRARVEGLLAADAGAGHFLRQLADTTTTGAVSEKPGDRIGRYRLLERIGRGGGGVVYLAEQEEPVRRRVALKILKLGMDTESVVARFEAERQALAMMDHPNIARVLDAGATETGRPFFVMELVTGQRLMEYCQRQQLSLQQRLELFIPVCHAVQHAHQKGVIHRDLKPSNILVTELEGVAVPKVIDFGIAKATQQGLDEHAGLTSANQFLGTPAYMSPEQMQFGGSDIDTRSDIYSLGVILYELLTGHPPFDPKELARAGLEEMRRIIREVDPPRPSTTITKNLNPTRLPSTRHPARERLAAIRSDLDWVVMKCLEKDRTRRYETANGLAMDIRRHLEHEPVVARPPSGLYRLQKIVRRHRLAFTATGTVTVVLIAAVIVSTQLALRARRAEREQGRLRDLAEAKAGESRLRLIRRYVAEGNRLMEAGRPTLALPWMVEALQLETGDPKREADERLRIGQALVGAPQLLLHLAQGKSVNCVALDNHGSRVATGADDGVVRITDVATGTEVGKELRLPDSVGRVVFSPDGTRLAAIDMEGRAQIINVASGEPLTPLLRPDDFTALANSSAERQLKPAASFSPDGKLLLVAWASKSAQLWDAANGALRHRFPHDEAVYHAAFSLDGKFVVTSSKDKTARVWDVATGDPAGPPLLHTGIVTWAQFSSDGTKVLTVRESHDVQLWNWREAHRVAPEIPRRSVLHHASLSPNGSNILTTARSGYAHVYDSASSQLLYQFEYAGGLLDTTYAPDGRHIATACHDGNVWVRESDSDDPHPMVLPEGNQIEQIAFSADGLRLAVAARGGHARVWELFPPQRGVRRLPGTDVDAVEFDSSGRRALLLNLGEKRGLSLYDVHSGELVWTSNFSSDQVSETRFSPDGGRILAFGSGRAVRVLDADSGRELVPPMKHNSRLTDAVWSPDGKWILSAARTGNALAWDSTTGKPAMTFSNSNPIVAIAVSPDGQRFVTGHGDNTIQLWDIRTGRPETAGFKGPGNIRRIHFSTDGKLLAISGCPRGEEGIVEIRDVQSGKVVGNSLVHRNGVNFFEFSRDGRWLATACDDHNARIWNGTNGEAVSAWLPHEHEARQVNFSPDGTRLVTLARRGAVRLWSVPSGEPITAPILYHRNRGDGAVSYSPDGQRLLIARGGNEAWVRELQPEMTTIQELRLLAQSLSCTKFDPASGMVPLDESGMAEAWQRLRSLHAGH